MKRLAAWLGMVIGFPLFLLFYVLYLFVFEPLCWLIYAPGSVWAGARVLAKKWLTGRE